MFHSLATRIQTSYTFMRLTSLVFVALLAACNTHKNNKYSNETSYFSKFLKTAFNQEINNDSTNYVLISDNGCHGCIARTIHIMSEYRRSTFIVSKDMYNEHRKDFNNIKAHLLVDSTMAINRLRYHNGNIGIVQAEEGDIFNILYIDIANLDEQINTIRK